MEITAIEILTRTKRRITFDDDIRWTLKASDVEALGFYEGMDIEPEVYDRLYDTYVLNSARHKALSLLEKSDYTQKELESRLSREGFPADAIRAAADYVCSCHYVDDERYARNYILYHSSGKSRQMICQTLAAKGIDADVIEACMEENGPDDAKNIRRICEKKFGDICGLSPEKKQKAFNYLLRRGYRYGDIAGILKDFDSI